MTSRTLWSAEQQLKLELFGNLVFLPGGLSFFVIILAVDESSRSDKDKRKPQNVVLNGETWGVAAHDAL